jgi:xanthine dehydrogenase YagS FAD-binding subunit
VRSGDERRAALAGVAPIPWLLEDGFAGATPLPGTAYKVELGEALVRRAFASL